MMVHLIIKEVGTLDHGFSATQDFTLGLTGWLIFLLVLEFFSLVCCHLLIEGLKVDNDIFLLVSQIWIPLQWLLYILTIIILASTTKEGSGKYGRGIPTVPLLLTSGVILLTSPIHWLTIKKIRSSLKTNQLNKIKQPPNLKIDY